MIWGFLMQNLAYGVIMPLYLALHLSTSETVAPCKANIATGAIELACTVPTITLGYVVPSILLGLPAPSVWSHEGKQIMMALWQVFPLWVALLQPLLTYTVTFHARVVGSPVMENGQNIIVVFRLVYMFLLTLVGVSHIFAVILMLTSKMFPGLLSPGVVGIFDPSKVAIPIALTTFSKVSSVGEGTHLLFQYDNMVGSAAMALWATVIYLRACKQNKTTPSLARLIVQVVSLIIFTGPVGYAIIMIWSRDELVYGKKNIERKKTM